MKAMVLAAGLGTRLRPLTYEITKPMVPVLDRPVMEHILDLLARHGFDEVIANLHYFPDTIREHFGERLQLPLRGGAAGHGRRCACLRELLRRGAVPRDLRRCADRHRPGALAARHRQSGGIATLAVKQVPTRASTAWCCTTRDGRITGFQEKPAPEEALSNLGNCGIYVFDPRIFDYFPARPFVDWAQDVFPVLLENDVPFHIHEIARVLERRRLARASCKQGTFDALDGRAAPGGRAGERDRSRA